MDIEDLPYLVSSGKISKTDAVKRIAEEIYRAPRRFALASYDEDFRSEIIVAFLQKGCNVFARYNATCGSFRGYLYAFIQGLILTQKRVEMKNFLANETIKEFNYPYPRDFENDIEHDNLHVAEKTVNYAPVENTQIWKSIRKRCPTHSASNAKMALILALKSSYYIPLDSIDTVSSYCHLRNTELTRIIATLNSYLYTRIRRRNSAIQRRDNAYYFHRKYYLQMKYNNTGALHLESLKKKYIHQTENWRCKNKELQERRYRVCPTNKMIARVLGICERQVSYYITRAQKMADREQCNKK